MPTPLPRRPDVALPILIFGAALYAYLCIPAITQRGYPPIDPIWDGVAYLWLVPVALSAIFDSHRFRSRWRELMGYALFTAFFFAGTFTDVVPKQVDILGMLLIATFLGPIHWIIAIAVDAAVQLLLRRSRALVDVAAEMPSGVPKLPLAALILGYSIVCLAAGLPFAYRHFAIEQRHREGAAHAELEWNARAAEFYGDSFQEVEDPASGALIIYSVDRKTGLPLRPIRDQFGFSKGYNARIRELVREHGRPAWAVEQSIPSPAEIGRLLKADGFERVATFPYKVTPDVSVGYAPGGNAPRGSADLMIIGAKHATSLGSERVPVMIKRDGSLVYVRYGAEQVHIYHRNGQNIAQAAIAKQQRRVASPPAATR